MARPITDPSPRRSSSPARCLAASALALALASAGCKVEVTSGSVAAPGPRRAPAANAPQEPAARRRSLPGRTPAAPTATSARSAAPPWAGDELRPDPEARRAFLLRLGQAPAPLGPADTTPRVTALALANTARGEAQGMRLDGGTWSAQLAEGARATAPVTIAPGECATFIAQGGLGLVEVDLFLTAAAAERQVLAEDPMAGPIAVIGGRGACFPNPGPRPLAVELHVQARRGAGVVLVQGYRSAGKPER